MNPTVSVFASCLETQPIAHPTLSQLVASIRSPRQSVREICAAIRREPEKTKRTALKKGLPAITWSADLHTRAGGVSGPDRELSRSGLICLDLDGLADLDGTRVAIQADPHTMVVFLSPSGDGLKVLVPIVGRFEDHWQALSDHVLSRYQITVDRARSDVHGLCYASHDPDIFEAANHDAVEPFRETRSNAHQSDFNAPRLSVYAQDGAVLSDFVDQSSAQSALNAINPDITYQEWIEIGQALHCQFGGGNIGLDLWTQWSSGGAKFAGEKDVYSHYKSFRGGGVTFRTVLRRALDAGWTMPKKARLDEPMRVEKKQTLSAFAQSFEDIMSGKVRSIDWPWRSFDENTQALSPGTTTLLVGTPGSTKSFMLLQLALELYGTGVPFSVLELEQSSEFWQYRLLAVISKNGGMTNRRWVEAHPLQSRSVFNLHSGTVLDVMQSFTVGNGLTVNHVLAWAKEQGEKGRRVIAIDPITAVDEDGAKPSDVAKKLMTELNALAMHYGMSIVVVTHNTSLSGIRGAPTLDHVAGGKGFTRLCDTVMWVSVAESDEEAVIVRSTGDDVAGISNRRVRLLKTRSGGGLGEVIALHFDGTTLNTSEIGLISRGIAKEMPKRKKRLVTTDADAPTNNEDLF